MTYKTRANSQEVELWNVSLLPTVKVAASVTPPRGPAPVGGGALPRPAVLSLTEVTVAAQLAEAA